MLTATLAAGPTVFAPNGGGGSTLPVAPAQMFTFQQKPTTPTLPVAPTTPPSPPPTPMQPVTLTPAQAAAAAAAAKKNGAEPPTPWYKKKTTWGIAAAVVAVGVAGYVILR